jgi:gamma-glutamyltranspeptidase/glutathione hydrolase
MSARQSVSYRGHRRGWVALWRPWVLVGLFLTAFNTAAQPDSSLNPEIATGWSPQPEQRFKRQAVVTAHPLASDAALRMLRAGGSAIDAAVAAQMVLTLVEPQSSGLGGGAFLLHSDGQELLADEQLFMRPDGTPMPWREAVVGGRSVGVPGVLKMLELAHRLHGRLPWKRLFEPAIQWAERGFPVTPRLHQILQRDAYLRQDPTAAAYFYDANGQAWPVGHRLRNPALARSLRRIAQQGAKAFYQGHLAREMVDRVQSHPTQPGRLRLEDLRDYQPVVRTALCHLQSFQTLASGTRRYRICGFPPPSSGGLAIGQVLTLLQHTPARQWPHQATPQGGLPAEPWAHFFTESLRLAYADRALYVADPAFTPAPGGQWSSLLDPGYLAERARLMSSDVDGPSMKTAPAGQPSPRAQSWAPMPEQIERGTSHMSVVDSRGHAVAMTSSIEDGLGARLMVGGFLLNNQLTDFSFLPRGADGQPVANRVQAGKRPRSSMSPTLVLDAGNGELLAVLGSPGGALIIPYVAQALWALLQEQMPPQQAVSLPHLASLNGPTLLEAGRFPPGWRQQLEARGAPVREVPMTSGLHLLVRSGPPGQRVWISGVDPRREGRAVGD